MPSLALLGIPFEAASSWRRGLARAPAAIRAELQRARSYSNLTAEDGTDLGRPGLLLDAGDVGISEDTAAVREAITAAAGAQLHAGHRLLSLGLTQRGTVWVLYGVSFVLGAGAFAVTVSNNLVSSGVLVVVALATPADSRPGGFRHLGKRPGRAGARSNVGAPVRCRGAGGNGAMVGL